MMTVNHAQNVRDFLNGARVVAAYVAHEESKMHPVKKYLYEELFGDQAGKTFNEERDYFQQELQNSDASPVVAFYRWLGKQVGNNASASLPLFYHVSKACFQMLSPQSALPATVQEATTFLQSQVAQITDAALDVAKRYDLIKQGYVKRLDTLLQGFPR